MILPPLQPEDEDFVTVLAEDDEGFEDEYRAEVVGLRFIPEDPEGAHGPEWDWEYVLVYDLNGEIMSQADRRWSVLAEQAVVESVRRREDA
mgnify:CR=1 FL=1